MISIMKNIHEAVPGKENKVNELVNTRLDSIGDYGGLLPPLSTEEFAALKADIKLNGVLQAVVVDERGEILDGRHRLKIDPKAPRKVVRGLSPAEKQAFVFRSNFVRRNLSPEQKREALNRMRRVAKDLRDEDKKKWTNAKVGAALGVSEITVRRWREDGTNRHKSNSSDPRTQSASDRPDARVKVPARDKGHIAQLVSAGVSPAQVAADYGVTDRTVRGIVAKARKHFEAAEIRRQATEAGSCQGEVRAVDCFEMFDEFRGNVDLLLTDPPYMTDVDDIQAHARRVCSWIAAVKPNGRCYIFTGAYPMEHAAYLDALRADWIRAAGFTLANMLTWTFENAIGPAPSHDYRINGHACFYLRGPEAPALDCPKLLEHFTVHRVNAPDGRLGDRVHAWQKPDELAERFIRHATEPGHLVLDPYAGTGTFVAAAKRLNRRGIGAENDPTMLRLCAARGLEILASAEQANALAEAREKRIA
jgi:DNA modification methylase